jgi:hypothetical protein
MEQKETGGQACTSHFKQAAFSLFPRYAPNQYSSVLGYSMTTVFDGVEWRYTEWVPFDKDATWTAAGYNVGRFEEVADGEWCADRRQCHAARELYNHGMDPQENNNVEAAEPAVVARLSAQLRAGWRPAFPYHYDKTHGSVGDGALGGDRGSGGH